MRFVLQLLRGRRWMLVAVLLSTMGVSALGVVVDPLAMKWLVDVGLHGSDGGAVAWSLALLVSVGIVLRYVDYRAELLIVRLTTTSTARLVGDTLAGYYRAPYTAIVSQGDAYFASRVYEEPAKLVRTGLRLLIDLATQVIAAVVALAIAFYLSWKITILLLLVGPPLSFLAARFRRTMTRQASLEYETESVLRQVIKRAVGAHRTVGLFDLAGVAFGAVRGAVDTHMAALRARSASGAWFRLLSGSVMALAEAGVLIVAAHEVFVGALSIGGMFAYLTVFWRAMRSGAAVLGKVPELSVLRAGAARLDEWFAEPARVVEPGEGLELRAVSFSYGERQVLDRVTMRITEGQRVLIVGSNGSGKTTLAHVLAGLLRGSGDARLPVVHNVSAMLNPLQFLPCTLAQQLGLPTAGPKREAALRVLDKLELAGRLDDDPETFSDGLKRRAYIAMVLFKEAEVYIFDEPLAAIDEAGKEHVMAAIEERTRGKTVISIMHGDARFAEMFHRTIQLDAACPNGL